MAHQLYMQGMSYNTKDHWADQAQCKGKAFELFEYQEKDSPLAKGMTYRERLEFNTTNFELAAEICIECPVFFQCKEAATDEDRQWTVRGGEEPTRFQYERAQGVLDSTGKGRTCQRGHYLEFGGRCKLCKREARRKAKRNASS